MTGFARSFALAGITMLLVMPLMGCASAPAKKAGSSRFLTLFAYNYTDRYLLDVTVDGMWMGGVDAYTNGKSAMGPRPAKDKKKQHTVEVKWRVSGLYDMEANKYKRMPVEARSAVVPLKFPYPPDPGMLLLHFYPDGHVEAELVGRQQNHWGMRRIPIPKEHKDYVPAPSSS